MGFLFHIVQRQELFQNDQSIVDELKQIKRVFPRSPFLRAQKALLYYHAKGKTAFLLSAVVSLNT